MNITKFGWLLALMVLSGCMNIEKKILDDVQITTAVGYDAVDKNTIKATVVTPSYQPDKTVKNETFIAVSQLSKEVREKIDRQSDKPFVSGKLEITLYSKELAKEGLIQILDTLQRDPAIGSNLYLAVVEGSTKELLMKQYGNLDNGIYLSNLIDQNIKHGMLPETNLHEFLHAYYSEGADPFLPLLEAKGGKVNIKGIALFDKDKYVDQLESEAAFVFKTMLEKFSNEASFNINLSEEKEEYASVYNISAKRDYKISKPATNPDITIHVKIDAILREFSGERVDKKILQKIERKMTEKIEGKANEMMKEFQKFGIDPLGIGEQIRTRTRTWDKKKWEEIYPDIPIKVKVKVDVTESGVIE
ncbi:Ger(x)C family spore germination protein [Priestia abyssalis]|uniref:Ger(x)C family spore germination protein n=1 Tax=Priestia abyssalis TaxID=1221450 RepID=UPI00099515BE|nr:Ger(x)C family spore germination protein [Priestia abyssalis]